MSEAVASPVVVSLPRVVDAGNSEKICAELCSALDDGKAVVADMTPTIFCDASGFRVLLVALDRAVENGVQLLIAVSADGSVLRSLDLMGLGQVLQIFPSLHEALAV